MPRLSKYNASLTMATFNALYHSMCFLLHHRHVPIVYKRGSCDSNKLEAYMFKGRAGIVDLDTFQGFKVYTDADLARNLSSRRSISSVVIERNSS